MLVRKPSSIQGHSDFLTACTTECHIKYPAHYLYGRGRISLWLQFVSGLIPVSYRDLFETIRWPASIVETTLGVFSHPSLDVLPHILTVEFINSFNDSLQQVTGWSVIQRFIDGDNLDSPIPQQLLISDGVNTIPGKTTS